MTMPISRKITDVDKVFDPENISEEEKRAVQYRIYEKYKNRFSKKNISSFVLGTLLKDKQSVLASDITTETKRDMIRIAFISLFGKDPRSEYRVIPKDGVISRQGFVFKDFEIRRKNK